MEMSIEKEKFLPVAQAAGNGCLETMGRWTDETFRLIPQAKGCAAEIFISAAHPFV